jgi:hydroxymethylglutaryl-CoA reductase
VRLTGVLRLFCSLRVGKGVEQALNIITTQFPETHVIALSGNVCTDKKPSAINWSANTLALYV